MADYPKGEIFHDRYKGLQGCRFNFAGMNFMTDPADLTIESGQCVDLCNCDVDYAYNVSRRQGYTRVNIGNAHSLWSNDTSLYCSMDNILCRIDGVTYVPILNRSDNSYIYTGDLVSFKQVNTIVYFAVQGACGVIGTDDLATILTPDDMSNLAQRVSTTYPADYQDPAANFEVDAFKVALAEANGILEYFNGTLYYAVNNVVYCSKTFDVESHDVRFDVVTILPSKITMIARVTNGIYVSTAQSLFFLEGTGFVYNSQGFIVGGFTQHQVSTFGVIPGSDVRVNATLVPDAKAEDTVVLCSTNLGIFALCNGGRYLNLSADQIEMPVGTRAAALFREPVRVYQYIVCYNVDSDLYVIPDNTLNDDACIDTVLINTVNLCHSRYTHFAFNSFTYFDGKYLGANKRGIYHLTGDRDFEGEVGHEADIDSVILTPITDFDTQEKKQCSDAYLHTRQTEDMAIDIIVNEMDEYEEFIVQHNYLDGIHRRRVMLPRGLHGTNWQFRLRNLNGGDFTAFDLEIFAKALQRVVR